MPDVPTSPGLRRFHEVCVVPAPPEALNNTWVVHRDWVMDHVPQEQILEINMLLYEDLAPISQAEEGTPEDRLGEAIREVADVVWYAMTEETMQRFNAALAERVDRERSQLSGPTTGTVGSSIR